MSIAKRDPAIDTAKAFLIFLVLFAHLPLPKELREAIYLFHMPVFAFLSGLVVGTPQKEGRLMFWRKRVLPILVSYILLLTLMYFVGPMLTGSLTASDSFLLSPGYYYWYFLFLILMGTGVSIVSDRKSIINPVFLTIGAFLVVALIGLDPPFKKIQRVIAHIPFYILGYRISKVENWRGSLGTLGSLLPKKVAQTKGMLHFLQWETFLLVGMFAFFLCFVALHVEEFALPFKPEGQALGKSLITYLVSVVMVFGFLALIKFITPKEGLTTFGLNWTALGAITIFPYAFNWFFVELWRFLFWRGANGALPWLFELDCLLDQGMLDGLKAFWSAIGASGFQKELGGELFFSNYMQTSNLALWKIMQAFGLASFILWATTRQSFRRLTGFLVTDHRWLYRKQT